MRSVDAGSLTSLGLEYLEVPKGLTQPEDEIRMEQFKILTDLRD